MTVLLQGLSSLLFGSIVVKGGLTHERSVTPGNTYQETIDLQNNGQEARRVLIYQTDYFFNKEGQTFYNEPGSVGRSNAQWIDYSPAEITLPPQENATVIYELSVPSIDTLAGTFWSMLMVEAMPVIEPDQGPTRGVGIETHIRYGVQIISNIGETGIRELQFLDTKITQDDSSQYLQVDVQNTGTHILRPTPKLELFNQQGKSVHKITARTRRTFPGTSVRFKLDITDIPPQKYNALLVADCGGDDLFGINFNLHIKE